MEKTNKLEQKCWVYQLNLNKTKPPSTEVHLLIKRNRNNAINAMYTRSSGKFHPLSTILPDWGGGAGVSNPGGAEGAADFRVVPIARTADMAVAAFPERPAALPVVPGNAVRGKEL